MALDELPDLDPDEGEVLDAEVVVSEDVLVKAFALGPGAEVDPHEHEDCTNVFHVLYGIATVTRDDEEEAVPAPGVVHNPPGSEHGVENGTDEPVLLTASLCPMPG